jgi:hypothetical protein
MTISDKLNHLFTICGINDFEFVFQKEGDKNYVDFSTSPNKKIVINIINEEDKELENLLSNKINELEELFQ